MSTRATHIRLADTSDPADPPVAIPSPAQVRATADAIRQAWTPRQRQRRAMTARLLEFEQLINENEDAPGDDVADQLAAEMPRTTHAADTVVDTTDEDHGLDGEPAILPFKPRRPS